MTFTNTWAYILAHLSAGQVVESWAVEKGYLDVPFRVESVTPNAVLIAGPKVSKVNRIPREGFERVFEHWAQYKEGGDLDLKGHINISTSYIISILHWVETNNDGILP